jgi:hypothetical protein
MANNTAGAVASDASNALNIYSGLQQGGVRGYGRAATNAGQLAGRLSGNSTLRAGSAGLGGLLGLYLGLRQGGAEGYASAAAGGLGAAGAGASLAGDTALGGVLGSAAGTIAAPLAVYEAVNNYQSGKTGQDAAQDASAGAAVGSAFGPIGTAAGAVIGGAVGALSSAFGPGAKDPETADVQGLIDYTGAHGNNPMYARSVSDPYLELAGLMDRRSSTLPMYSQYGRMGEQKFSNDLASQINNSFTRGISSGSLAGDKWSIDPSSGDYILTTPTGGKTSYAPNQGAAEVYNSVVGPWVNNMGSGYKNVGQTYAETTQGLLQDMTQQYLAGQAGNDWKSVGGQEPFANIYQGTPFTAAPTDVTPMPSSAVTLQASRLSPGAASRITGANAPITQTPQEPNTPTARPTVSAASRLAAKGGNVNYKDRLKTLKTSVPRGKTHFSDGSDGGIDLSGGSGGSSWIDYTPTPEYNTSGVPTDIAAPDNSGNYGPVVQDPYGNYSAGPVYYGDSSTGSSDSPASSSSGSSGSGVSSLLSSLAPYLKAGAIASPILAGLLSKGSSSGSAPGTAAGFGAPGAVTTPNFTRAAVANPTNNATGTPMSTQDWYTYGQRPEVNFFSNNQIPTVAGVSPASATAAPATSGAIGTANTQPIHAPLVQLRASGGALGQALGDMDDGSDAGHHVQGPGDGTSDDIDAKLSDGEYVMDANTVSMLGNGSNKAGAAALDRLRQNLRRHAAKPMAKGKQFMKAKPPEAYMRGGSK